MIAMAYLKKTWATGEVVAAAALNNLENGVAAAVPLDGSALMTGPLKTPALKIAGVSAALDKTLFINFTPDAVANQKANLILGNITFAGFLEVEITSGNNAALAVGRVVRLFALGFNPNNGGYANISRYTEAYGQVATEFAIGALTWDATNLRWYIPLVHRTNKANGLGVRVRAFTIASSQADALETNLAIGPIYTTDATVYPAPVVDLPTGATVAGSPILHDGNVGSTAPNNAVQLIKALFQDADTRASTFTYTGGDLTGITIKDGAATVKTVTVNYTSGNVSSIVEVVGGKTITTTLTYNPDGSVSGQTRSVV